MKHDKLRRLALTKTVTQPKIVATNRARTARALIPINS